MHNIGDIELHDIIKLGIVRVQQWLKHPVTDTGRISVIHDFIQHAFVDSLRNVI